MGITLKDIKKMQRLIEILGEVEKGKKKGEVQVWKDVGIFKDIFPQEKSSLEILQELRKKALR